MKSTDKTKKNEEDEKMALLEKIKDASNGPEQVGRRVRLYFFFSSKKQTRHTKNFFLQIRELDKTIANLKKSRRKCQKAIDDDMEKIKWIDKEMESIRARLNPLVGAVQIVYTIRFFVLIFVVQRDEVLHVQNLLRFGRARPRRKT